MTTVSASSADTASLAMLPGSSLLSELTDEVRQTLEEERMLEGVQRLGVAVSGGADSLVLLEILLSPELDDLLAGVKIVPLHISQYDPMSHLRLSHFISETYKLDLHVVRQDTREVAQRLIDRGKAPCRACAPRRNKAIGRLSSDLHLDSVAFGHHLTDAAATLLLNIFHEGSTRPLLPVVLRGRGTRRYRVIRPLYYSAERRIKELSPVGPHGLFDCGSCELYADERERNRRFVAETFERHGQSSDFARTLLRRLVLAADAPRV